MHPRYLTVAGACLTQFIVIGVLFSFGLFFRELQAEFGWSRTLLSGANTVAFFMMGVVALLSGRLIDRFGPRPVLGVSGLLYGLGYVLLAQSTEPWQVYLIFAVLIGVGLGTHDVGTLSTVGRWFTDRRGLMTAVVKIGTALGQMAVPLLAAGLIAARGWQSALVLLGVGAAGLLVVAALTMRAPPPLTGTPGQHTTTRVDLRRSRLFWTLCAIQFLFFPALMSLPLHLPVHAMDLGQSRTQAATLLSAIGGASIAGRLVVGGLVDRIGGRSGYLVCFAALIIGLVGFLSVSSPPALIVFVLIYGFGHGGFFTVVSPTIAEYFGIEALGAAFGTVLFFGTIGGAVGPILAGFAFDLSGSYLPAFGALLGFALLGLGLVLTLPRRD